MTDDELLQQVLEREARITEHFDTAVSGLIHLLNVLQRLLLGLRRLLVGLLILLVVGAVLLGFTWSGQSNLIRHSDRNAKILCDHIGVGPQREPAECVKLTQP